MNLYEKLAKIRKPVEVMRKDKSGYGYNYVSDAEILAKITGLMDKYGVSLIPSVSPATIRVDPYSYTDVKFDKAGKELRKTTNEVLVSADLVFRWVNNEDPTECIEVPWAMAGQQSDASQAFGSGMTYCRRYFLLHFFNVSTTEDDPDAWRSKQKATEVEQLLHQVGQSIAIHLERVPADRDKVAEIVKKYAKDKAKQPTANYKLITDPDAAQRLLDELTTLDAAIVKEE